VKVRLREVGLVRCLRQRIQSCQAVGLALPGISDSLTEDVFLGQLIDSIRRVQYVLTIAKRPISPSRADASSALFDPLKAAILNLRNGNVDEACWLVFLFIHFGRHPMSGWRYAREVYDALGNGTGWTWANVSIDPGAFRDWLRRNENELTRGRDRGFGNHRKYLSMSADKPAGTGAAVASYVRWVMEAGSHQALFSAAISSAKGMAEIAFDLLYRSMGSVTSFGRMAKFDYLTMISKLGIANIRPGSAYIPGSTGPIAGARQMFQIPGKRILHPAEFDKKIIDLAHHLQVGMQEIEDSICNWQKSPREYQYFGG